MNEDKFAPFDAKWLREQLQTAVLKGSWNIPSPGELDFLAGTLNSLERRIRTYVNTKTLAEDFREIAKALNLAEDLAPRIIEMCYYPRRKDLIQEQVSAFQERIRMASEVLAAARDFGLMKLSASSLRGQRWKLFSSHIAGAFIDSLSRANPGREIGYSGGGPVSRFVHLVVPRITGESPALESVSAQLKHDARRLRSAQSILAKVIADNPPTDSDAPF